jgi:hypothetical protein
MVVHKNALLIVREVDDAPLVVRIAEGGEDPAADAKVGMPVMPLFDGIPEAERNSPKSGCGHARILAAPPEVVKPPGHNSRRGATPPSGCVLPAAC